MRICPQCGHKNDDVNFCSSCGHDLRTQPGGRAFCSHCGATQNNVDNIYCGKCGRRIKGRKKGKYIWIFLLLPIMALVCCLVLFRQNDDNVPQETICQHEWQNNGVMSICTRCSGVIITPSDTETSEETIITTENAAEMEPKDLDNKNDEESGKGNSVEVTESLISFLKDYEKEYGNLFESYFTFDGTPSFSPALLEDIDADGEKELILHTFPCVEYDEDSVYGSQVEQYTVYGYHNGEWIVEKEPQVVGSLSYAGFSGHAGVLQKDGKPLLYTHEWKAPYGTSEGPGVEFTYLITVYDSKYSVDATFTIIKRWEGELDEDSYKEIVEYKVNGKAVSLERFIDTISKYDGIFWNEVDNWYDFETDAVTVEMFLSQLR